MGGFKIRPAVREDIPIIMEFIKELAEYESLSDQVFATEEILTKWIFDKEKAEAIIGEVDGQPVGYGLFFFNFSTFIGRAGIYLEDLYVRPLHRKKGYGKAMFLYLAKLCLERDCGRLEWSCLDWNKSSIDFYLSMGAVPMHEWTIYRLTEDALKKLAEK